MPMQKGYVATPTSDARPQSKDEPSNLFTKVLRAIVQEADPVTFATRPLPPLVPNRLNSRLSPFSPQRHLLTVASDTHVPQWHARRATESEQTSAHFVALCVYRSRPRFQCIVVFCWCLKIGASTPGGQLCNRGRDSAPLAPKQSRWRAPHNTSSLDFSA